MSTVLTIDVPGTEFDDGFTLNTAEYIPSGTPRYYLAADVDSNPYVFDANTSLFQAITSSKTIDFVYNLFRIDSKLYAVGEFDIAGPLNEVFIYNVTDNVYLTALSGLGTVQDSFDDGTVLYWHRTPALSSTSSVTKEFTLVNTGAGTTSSFRLSGNTGALSGYKVGTDLTRLLDTDRILFGLLATSGGAPRIVIYSLSAESYTDLDTNGNNMSAWSLNFVSDDKKFAFGTFYINDDFSTPLIARWDLTTGEMLEPDFGDYEFTGASSMFATNRYGSLLHTQLQAVSGGSLFEAIVDFTDTENLVVTRVSDFLTTYLPDGFVEGDISVTFGFRSVYYFVYFSTGSSLIAINPLGDVLDNDEPLIGGRPQSTFLRLRLLGYF